MYNMTYCGFIIWQEEMTTEQYLVFGQKMKEYLYK